MSSKVEWVKAEVKKRGYVYDGKSKCKKFHKAKAFYPTGARVLHFEVIKCEICKKNYLKPRWSKAVAHKLCSIDKYNRAKHFRSDK